MKEKEPTAKPKKADDPMCLEASKFDELMRHALGVPPEKEAKPKAKKKK